MEDVDNDYGFEIIGFIALFPIILLFFMLVAILYEIYIFYEMIKEFVIKPILKK